MVEGPSTAEITSLIKLIILFLKNYLQRVLSGTFMKYQGKST